MRILSTLFLGLFFSISAEAQDCSTANVNGPIMWRPLIHIEDGVRKGPLIKNVQEILKIADIKPTFGQIQSINRSLRDLDTGNIDIYFAAVSTAKRREKYHVTAPFMYGSEFGFVYVDNEKPRPKVMNANILTFPQVRHLPLVQKILNNTPNTIVIDSVERALRLLKNGKFHYITSTLSSLEKVKGQYGFGNLKLKLLDAPKIQLRVHMLVNKNSACSAKLEHLNTAIEKWKLSNPHTVNNVD